MISLHRCSLLLFFLSLTPIRPEISWICREIPLDLDTNQLLIHNNISPSKESLPSLQNHNSKTLSCTQSKRDSGHYLTYTTIQNDTFHFSHNDFIPQQGKMHIVNFSTKQLYNFDTPILPQHSTIPSSSYLAIHEKDCDLDVIVSLNPYSSLIEFDNFAFSSPPNIHNASIAPTPFLNIHTPSYLHTFSLLPMALLTLNSSEKTVLIPSRDALDELNLSLPWEKQRDLLSVLESKEALQAKESAFLREGKGDSNRYFIKERFKKEEPLLKQMDYAISLTYVDNPWRSPYASFAIRDEEEKQFRDSDSNLSPPGDRATSEQRETTTEKNESELDNSSFTTSLLQHIRQEEDGRGSNRSMGSYQSDFQGELVLASNESNGNNDEDRSWDSKYDGGKVLQQDSGFELDGFQIFDGSSDSQKMPESWDVDSIPSTERVVYATEIARSFNSCINNRDEVIDVSILDFEHAAPPVEMGYEMNTNQIFDWSRDTEEEAKEAEHSLMYINTAPEDMSYELGVLDASKDDNDSEMVDYSKLGPEEYEFKDMMMKMEIARKRGMSITNRFNEFNAKDPMERNSLAHSSWDERLRTIGLSGRSSNDEIDLEIAAKGDGADFPSDIEEKGMIRNGDLSNDASLPLDAREYSNKEERSQAEGSEVSESSEGTSLHSSHSSQRSSRRNPVENFDNSSVSHSPTPSREPCNFYKEKYESNYDNRVRLMFHQWFGKEKEDIMQKHTQERGERLLVKMYLLMTQLGFVFELPPIWESEEVYDIWVEELQVSNVLNVVPLRNLDMPWFQESLAKEEEKRRRFYTILNSLVSVIPTVEVYRDDGAVAKCNIHHHLLGRLSLIKWSEVQVLRFSLPCTHACERLNKQNDASWMNQYILLTLPRALFSNNYEKVESYRPFLSNIQALQKFYWFLNHLFQLLDESDWTWDKILLLQNLDPSSLSKNHNWRSLLSNSLHPAYDKIIVQFARLLDVLWQQAEVQQKSLLITNHVTQLRSGEQSIIPVFWRHPVKAKLWIEAFRNRESLPKSSVDDYTPSMSPSLKQNDISVPTKDFHLSSIIDILLKFIHPLFASNRFLELHMNNGEIEVIDPLHNSNLINSKIENDFLNNNIDYIEIKCNENMGNQKIIVDCNKTNKNGRIIRNIKLSSTYVKEVFNSNKIWEWPELIRKAMVEVTLYREREVSSPTDDFFGFKSLETIDEQSNNGFLAFLFPPTYKQINSVLLSFLSFKFTGKAVAKPFWDKDALFNFCLDMLRRIGIVRNSIHSSTHSEGEDNSENRLNNLIEELIISHWRVSLFLIGDSINIRSINENITMKNDQTLTNTVPYNAHSVIKISISPIYPLPDIIDMLHWDRGYSTLSDSYHARDIVLEVYKHPDGALSKKYGAAMAKGQDLRLLDYLELIFGLNDRITKRLIRFNLELSQFTSNLTPFSIWLNEYEYDHWIDNLLYLFPNQLKKEEGEDSSTAKLERKTVEKIDTNLTKLEWISSAISRINGQIEVVPEWSFPSKMEEGLVDTLHDNDLLFPILTKVNINSPDRTPVYSPHSMSVISSKIYHIHAPEIHTFLAKSSAIKEGKMPPIKSDVLYESNIITIILNAAIQFYSSIHSSIVNLMSLRDYEIKWKDNSIEHKTTNAQSSLKNTKPAAQKDLISILFMKIKRFNCKKVVIAYVGLLRLGMVKVIPPIWQSAETYDLWMSELSRIFKGNNRKKFSSSLPLNNEGYIFSQFANKKTLESHFDSSSHLFIASLEKSVSNNENCNARFDELLGLLLSIYEAIDVFLLNGYWVRVSDKNIEYYLHDNKISRQDIPYYFLYIKYIMIDHTQAIFEHVGDTVSPIMNSKIVNDWRLGDIFPSQLTPDSIINLVKAIDINIQQQSTGDLSKDFWSKIVAELQTSMQELISKGLEKKPIKNITSLSIFESLKEEDPSSNLQKSNETASKVEHELVVLNSADGNRLTASFTGSDNINPRQQVFDKNNEVAVEGFREAKIPAEVLVLQKDTKDFQKESLLKNYLNYVSLGFLGEIPPVWWSSQELEIWLKTWMSTDLLNDAQCELMLYRALAQNDALNDRGTGIKALKVLDRLLLLVDVLLCNYEVIYLHLSNNVVVEKKKSGERIIQRDYVLIGFTYNHLMVHKIVISPADNRTNRASSETEQVYLISNITPLNILKDNSLLYNYIQYRNSISIQLSRSSMADASTAENLIDGLANDLQFLDEVVEDFTIALPNEISNSIITMYKDLQKLYDISMSFERPTDGDPQLLLHGTPLYIVSDLMSTNSFSKQLTRRNVMFLQAILDNWTDIWWNSQRSMRTYHLKAINLGTESILPSIWFDNKLFNRTLWELQTTFVIPHLIDTASPKFNTKLLSPYNVKGVDGRLFLLLTCLLASFGEIEIYCNNGSFFKWNTAHIIMKMKMACTANEIGYLRLASEKRLYPKDGFAFPWGRSALDKAKEIGQSAEFVLALFDPKLVINKERIKIRQIGSFEDSSELISEHAQEDVFKPQEVSQSTHDKTSRFIKLMTKNIFHGNNSNTNILPSFWIDDTIYTEWMKELAYYGLIDESWELRLSFEYKRIPKANKGQSTTEYNILHESLQSYIRLCVLINVLPIKLNIALSTLPGSDYVPMHCRNYRFSVLEKDDIIYDLAPFQSQFLYYYHNEDKKRDGGERVFWTNPRLDKRENEVIAAQNEVFERDSRALSSNAASEDYPERLLDHKVRILLHRIQIYMTLLIAGEVLILPPIWLHLRDIDVWFEALKLPAIQDSISSKHLDINIFDVSGLSLRDKFDTLVSLLVKLGLVAEMMEGSGASSIILNQIMFDSDLVFPQEITISINTKILLHPHCLIASNDNELFLPKAGVSNILLLSSLSDCVKETRSSNALKETSEIILMESEVDSLISANGLSLSKNYNELYRCAISITKVQHSAHKKLCQRSFHSISLLEIIQLENTDSHLKDGKLGGNMGGKEYDEVMQMNHEILLIITYVDLIRQGYQTIIPAIWETEEYFGVWIKLLEDINIIKKEQWSRHNEDNFLEDEDIVNFFNSVNESADSYINREVMEMELRLSELIGRLLKTFYIIELHLQDGYWIQKSDNGETFYHEDSVMEKNRIPIYSTQVTYIRIPPSELKLQLTPERLESQSIMREFTPYVVKLLFDPIKEGSTTIESHVIITQLGTQPSEYHSIPQPLAKKHSLSDIPLERMLIESVEYWIAATELASVKEGNILNDAMSDTLIEDKQEHNINKGELRDKVRSKGHDNASARNQEEEEYLTSGSIPPSFYLLVAKAFDEAITFNNRTLHSWRHQEDFSRWISSLIDSFPLQDALLDNNTTTNYSRKDYNTSNAIQSPQPEKDILEKQLADYPSKIIEFQAHPEMDKQDSAIFHEKRITKQKKNAIAFDESTSVRLHSMTRFLELIHSQAISDIPPVVVDIHSDIIHLSFSEKILEVKELQVSISSLLSLNKHLKELSSMIKELDGVVTLLSETYTIFEINATQHLKLKNKIIKDVLVDHIIIYTLLHWGRQLIHSSGSSDFNVDSDVKQEGLHILYEDYFLNVEPNELRNEESILNLNRLRSSVHNDPKDVIAKFIERLNKGLGGRVSDIWRDEYYYINWMEEIVLLEMQQRLQTNDWSSRWREANNLQEKFQFFINSILSSYQQATLHVVNNNNNTMWSWTLNNASFSSEINLCSQSTVILVSIPSKAELKKDSVKDEYGNIVDEEYRENKKLLEDIEKDNNERQLQYIYSRLNNINFIQFMTTLAPNDNMENNVAQSNHACPTINDQSDNVKDFPINNARELHPKNSITPQYVLLNPEAKDNKTAVKESQADKKEFKFRALAHRDTHVFGGHSSVGDSNKEEYVSLNSFSELFALVTNNINLWKKKEGFIKNYLTLLRFGFIVDIPPFWLSEKDSRLWGGSLVDMAYYRGNNPFEPTETIVPNDTSLSKEMTYQLDFKRFSAFMNKISKQAHKITNRPSPLGLSQKLFPLCENTDRELQNWDSSEFLTLFLEKDEVFYKIVMKTEKLQLHEGNTLLKIAKRMYMVIVNEETILGERTMEILKKIHDSEFQMTSGSVKVVSHLKGHETQLIYNYLSLIEILIPEEKIVAAEKLLPFSAPTLNQFPFAVIETQKSTVNFLGGVLSELFTGRLLQLEIIEIRRLAQEYIELLKNNSQLTLPRIWEDEVVYCIWMEELFEADIITSKWFQFCSEDTIDTNDNSLRIRTYRASRRKHWERKNPLYVDAKRSDSYLRLQHEIRSLDYYFEANCNVKKRLGKLLVAATQASFRVQISAVTFDNAKSEYSILDLFQFLSQNIAEAIKLAHDASFLLVSFEEDSMKTIKSYEFTDGFGLSYLASNGNLSPALVTSFFTPRGFLGWRDLRSLYGVSLMRIIETYEGSVSTEFFEGYRNSYNVLSRPLSDESLGQIPNKPLNPHETQRRKQAIHSYLKFVFLGIEGTIPSIWECALTFQYWCTEMMRFGFIPKHSDICATDQTELSKKESVARDEEKDNAEKRIILQDDQGESISEDKQKRFDALLDALLGSFSTVKLLLHNNRLLYLTSHNSYMIMEDNVLQRYEGQVKEIMLPNNAILKGENGWFGLPLECNLVINVPSNNTKSDTDKQSPHDSLSETPTTIAEWWNTTRVRYADLTASSLTRGFTDQLQHALFHHNKQQGIDSGLSQKLSLQKRIKRFFVRLIIHSSGILPDVWTTKDHYQVWTRELSLFMRIHQISPQENCSEEQSNTLEYPEIGSLDYMDVDTKMRLNSILCNLENLFEELHFVLVAPEEKERTYQQASASPTPETNQANGDSTSAWNVELEVAAKHPSISTELGERLLPYGNHYEPLGKEDSFVFDCEEFFYRLELLQTRLMIDPWLISFNGEQDETLSIKEDLEETLQENEKEVIETTRRRLSLTKPPSIPNESDPSNPMPLLEDNEREEEKEEERLHNNYPNRPRFLIFDRLLEKMKRAPIIAEDSAEDLPSAYVPEMESLLNNPQLVVDNDHPMSSLSSPTGKSTSPMTVIKSISVPNRQRVVEQIQPPSPPSSIELIKHEASETESEEDTELPNRQVQEEIEKERRAIMAYPKIILSSVHRSAYILTSEFLSELPVLNNSKHKTATTTLRIFRNSIWPQTLLNKVLQENKHFIHDPKDLLTLQHDKSFWKQRLELAEKEKHYILSKASNVVVAHANILAEQYALVYSAEGHHQFIRLPEVIQGKKSENLLPSRILFKDTPSFSINSSSLERNVDHVEEGEVPRDRKAGSLARSQFEKPFVTARAFKEKKKYPSLLIAHLLTPLRMRHASSNRWFTGVINVNEKYATEFVKECAVKETASVKAPLRSYVSISIHYTSPSMYLTVVNSPSTSDAAMEWHNYFSRPDCKFAISTILFFLVFFFFFTRS